MVDRQYEIMRRPRVLDDASAKNAIRHDDVDMHNTGEPAPIQATHAPVTDHEVSKISFTFQIQFI